MSTASSPRIRSGAAMRPCSRWHGRKTSIESSSHRHRGPTSRGASKESFVACSRSRTMWANVASSTVMKRTASGMPCGAGGSSAPGSSEVPEMAELSKTEQRKAEHVNIILQENVSAEYNYWNDVRLVHTALPEIDLDDVDVSVKFFGKRLEAPLIISSMTGGFGMGKEINANLAKAAAEVGVAMGVGSQRAALEKPELEPTYAVVKDYGVPLVFANLGAPQLVPQEGKRAYGVADARKAMQMIKADALIVHLNFLQEVVQPEGDRRAKGCLSAIKALASKFPLMAKETGAGISRETAQKLKAAGARAIDVGGLGGTSFSAGGDCRARKEAPGPEGRLRAAVWDLGIPAPSPIPLAEVGLSLF